MAGKAQSWQLHLFGGVAHTFTDPAIDALGMDGMVYDAFADRSSWAMMQTLLQISFAASPEAADRRDRS